MTNLEKADKEQVRDYQVAPWAESMARALQQTCGGSFCAKMFDEQEQTGGVNANDPCFWLRFSASGALQGELAISISRTDQVQLQQILVCGKPGSEKTSIQDLHEVLADFLCTTAALAGPALTKQLGRDVQFTHLGTGTPQWSAAASGGFHLTGEGNASVGVSLQVSEELMESLRSIPVGAGRFANFVPVNAAAPPPSTIETNLKLLKDVELEVTLHFGKRDMLLRDVFELAPGSVVELDRQTHDPVELLVGKKVVARGEVVVVDGNYGIRVTEIASPSERIASLSQ